MAHFYVSTENSRGTTVTASGSKSGQTTHARGWSSGIKVRAHVVDGVDVFDVYETGGSNGVGSDELLGTLSGGMWKCNPDAIDGDAFQERAGY